jgi:tetratricopeptide repeat protein 21B
MNNLDRCAQNCSILLNADPNNEAASVMMADLAFRKVDFDTAAFHFRQLLMRQPTYWTALARLIEVSRRTGTAGRYRYLPNFHRIFYEELTYC